MKYGNQYILLIVDSVFLYYVFRAISLGILILLLVVVLSNNSDIRPSHINLLFLVTELLHSLPQLIQCKHKHYNN